MCATKVLGTATKSVLVTYLKDGRLHRVRAKGVVMASGQWINKRVVRGLSATYREAMEFFHHAPMLTLNVAVRNWKFMEKVGISAARWFEGFGWWLSLKRQVLIDGSEPMPLDPNKPAVLQMYIPFPIPGIPLAQQAVAARMQLFGMSYRDIEEAILGQLTKMFGPHGFDRRRGTSPGSSPTAGGMHISFRSRDSSTEAAASQLRRTYSSNRSEGSHSVTRN